MTAVERWVAPDRRPRRVTPPGPDAVASTHPGPLSAREVELLHTFVADVTCTRRVGYRGHCRRSVTATLFEIQFARPCPLCRGCTECRDGCADGTVTHDGLDLGALFAGELG